MQPFHFFYPFFQKYCYIYSENTTGVFMKKKRERKNPLPPTDGSIKLSKYALWCLKHPEGEPLIIHDMRAVMR
jgi:hypothetical protein